MRFREHETAKKNKTKQKIVKLKSTSSCRSLGIRPRVLPERSLSHHFFFFPSSFLAIPGQRRKMSDYLADLGRVLAVDLGVQGLCGAVAIALQTEKFYDFSGSATFILLALFSYLKNRSGVEMGRSLINTGMVVAWASRLGSFLFYRILKDGKDRRFDKVRTNPKRFALFWFIQAIWIFLTALPVYMVNVQQNEETKFQPTLRDYIGWSCWVIGFLLQCTADFTKLNWNSNPANHGKWIDVGIWKYSQHPNYFGEMMMWTGLFLSCSNQFQGLEWASAVSPLFVVFLLRFVSGVPLLQKAGMKKWGKDAAYVKRVKNTSLLVPWFPSS